MYKLAKPLFIHCQSPMHVGSGSDLGLVDLPIQRESHTGFPKIEASSLKGAIREFFENKADKDADWYDIQLLFGYDDDSLQKCVREKFPTSKERDYSGALAFSDARLLFFPVKSFKGIFAYVTCPAVLKRFSADLLICGNQSEYFDPDDNDNNNPKIPTNTNTVSSNELLMEEKIILEEYSFKAKCDDTVKKLAECLDKDLQIGLKTRMVLLPDNVFSDFVKLFTEVITRNKIDNAKGTVAKGALFTEEYLPAESVLYSITFANSIFTDVESRKGSFKKKEDNKESEEQKVQDYFAAKIHDAFLQIGGNSTLGKGIVNTKFFNYDRKK